MSALCLIFFVIIYYKGKCLRLKNSKDDHKTLARKRGVMKGHKRKTKYRVEAIVKEGYTSVSKARKSLKTSSTTCLSNKLRGLHNMNTYQAFKEKEEDSLSKQHDKSPFFIPFDIKQPVSGQQPLHNVEITKTYSHLMIVETKNSVKSIIAKNYIVD